MFKDSHSAHDCFQYFQTQLTALAIAQGRSRIPQDTSRYSWYTLGRCGAHYSSEASCWYTVTYSGSCWRARFLVVHLGCWCTSTIPPGICSEVIICSGLDGRPRSRCSWIIDQMDEMAHAQCSKLEMPADGVNEIDKMQHGNQQMRWSLQNMTDTVQAI